MNVKNVPFGSKLQLKEGGRTYVRVNVSRNVVPRDVGTTVLVNAQSGKMRVVSKNVDVASYGTI